MRMPLIATLILALSVPAIAQYPGAGSGLGRGGRHGEQGGDPSQGGAALTRRAPERAMRPIPREAFEAQVRAAFADADLNGDGMVTLDEIRAAREARRDAMIDARFAQIDTNHDGTLSHGEFMAWQRHLGDPEMAHNARADGTPPLPDALADDAHDGPSPRDNRHANDLNANDLHANDLHGGRTPEGPHGGPLGFLIAPISANMVIEADSNHDGALSLAEDLAYQDALFAIADANHDGFIDEGELRMARVAREQR